jgi:hypothetical protein
MSTFLSQSEAPGMYKKLSGSHCTLPYPSVVAVDETVELPVELPVCDAVLVAVPDMVEDAVELPVADTVLVSVLVADDVADRDCVVVAELVAVVAVFDALVDAVLVCVDEAVFDADVEAVDDPVLLPVVDPVDDCVVTPHPLKLFGEEVYSSYRYSKPCATFWHNARLFESDSGPN